MLIHHHVILIHHLLILRFPFLQAVLMYLGCNQQLCESYNTAQVELIKVLLAILFAVRVALNVCTSD